MTCRLRTMFLLAPLTASATGIWDPQGPVAAADWQITLNALAIMLVIVVPTLVAVLAFAWWFRSSNSRARREPEFVYSGRLELLVWSIPLLTILFLSGVIWIGSHRLDPFQRISAPAKPLEIQVVSLDWKWLFIYPAERIAAVNELVIPAGVPLHFSLTSGSVMNAFWVPQLGSMVATMNGMQTQLYLQADRPGEYYGESTQFSGDGFSGMHFTVRAMPQGAFSQWVAGVRASGDALDARAYQGLARESVDVQPFTYREADPALFEAVVGQRVTPEPGPRHGRGPAVHPKPAS